MGVYIKGMEMPSGCDNCPFDNGKFCMAYPLSESMGYDIADGKPEWCPLVEVPPHLRLIEANEITDQILSVWTIIQERILSDWSKMRTRCLKRREKTMAELKPCPFCGGKPQLDHEYMGVCVYSKIRCTDCGATIKPIKISACESSDEKAICAWNRRSNDG